MAEKKSEKKPGKRTATFIAWAKELKRIPTALGATVALGIDKSQEMTEAEFNSTLEKYGKQKSFN
jgi:hypothetical protein